MRQIALLLLCTAGLLVAAVPAHAAMAGDLDPSFSDDGKLTTDFAGRTDFGQAVAVQPDGKVVVAGHTDGSGGPDFALARYNPDGSLDSSFSGDGRQTTDFERESTVGSDVAVQPDGKIVAVGSAEGDFAVARYLGASDSPPGPPPKCTVTGSSRGEVLLGTPGDDVICAGDGNDVVRAGGGKDTVYGGHGNDVVHAGSADDTVYGGRGNDILHADGGSDRLYGQGGNDVIRTSDGRRGNDSADGGGGDDACRGDAGDRHRSCSGR